MTISINITESNLGVSALMIAVNYYAILFTLTCIQITAICSITELEPDILMTISQKCFIKKLNAPQNVILIKYYSKLI